MNKKEIAELKKQYTPKNCAISRICGCYVNADKEKTVTFAQAFLPLPEEEMYKYFDLLRKSLSGSIGKTLHNMEFPLVKAEAFSQSADEAGSSGMPEMPEDAQSFLLRLRDSSLQDDSLLEEFYDRIISSFDYGEHYLILVIDSTYDVPGRASDELEMEDASDEVYHYLHTCICPVNLSKPALSYDPVAQCFKNRDRDWIVEPPLTGFLFPAFNDRSADIYSLLYYVKNAKEMYASFTDAMLGCASPLSAPAQKDMFAEIIEEALGEECSFETVRNLHEQLHELDQEQKENPDPVYLSRNEVKNLLSLSGASEEQLESFEKCYEEKAGPDLSFAAANVIPERKFEVNTPDVEIRVSPDRPDLVETKIIDGRPCLVIPITDEIHVNGIRVRPDTRTDE